VPGIDSNEHIVMVLLLDAVEDCDVTVDELEVNDEIKTAVTIFCHVRI